jgi:hypothetical protein
MKQSVRWLAMASLGALGALGTSSVAGAQAGVTLGTEYGLGGIARFGNRAALEVGAGLAPVLALNLTVSEDSKIYFPLAIGGKISFPLRGPDHEKPMGLKLGVTHNGVLGTGFGGGIDLVLGREPTVILGAGIMYYGDAQQGLTDRVNKDTGSNYTTVIDESVNVQPAFSISIIWPRKR